MDEKYTVKTVQKAIDLLELFKKHSKLPFTEIVNMLPFNRSTVFRLLYTLERNGYLSRDHHGRYELGLAIFVLGNMKSEIGTLERVSGPYLEELCNRTNLTVHLGVLDGYDVVIIDKRYPPRNIKMVSRIGSSVAPHCTAQGKTILAYINEALVKEIMDNYGFKIFTPNTITNISQLFDELKKIRENGYAFDNMEHEERIQCVGVPILNKENKIQAAVSLTGLALDFPDKKSITRNVKAVQEIVNKIRIEMGYK